MNLDNLSSTDILKQYFLIRKTKNENYSLRAYARDLGISSGRLSDLLNGNNIISLKKANEIVINFKLSEKEKKIFLLVVERENIKDDSRIKQINIQLTKYKYKEISDTIFSIISEWYHFAILEIASFQNVRQSNFKEISEKLEISKSDVEKAVSNLIKVNLITFDDNGVLQNTHNFLSTPDGVPNEALRKCHNDLLHKAINSLNNDEVHTRDFKNIIISIDSDKIDPIKKEIDDFLDSILLKYTSDKKRNSVYSMGINFFNLLKH